MSTIEYADQRAQQTVVVKATNYPLNEMGRLMDATFGSLFPILEERGIKPVGAAFSLHTRIPTDTTDLEVGIAVDGPFGAPVSIGEFSLESSQIPAGPTARTSHIGAYDGLGTAWGAFMQGVVDAGHQPAFPFWEIYVTQPTPVVEPASLQTDLVTLLG